ncbi:hypothetical protein XNC1_2418 [Xenorhabdus nematophila ATCC 19061]|uniref:Uncharacterized protein n=1 Tax=Xenorhabdus nematophila (strain ATCC 19061 / DSM 3370 / CCUG 14189 / LMG 1036 / NCIMB 9965 / AN6) TaxID=406817 RepID=D3VGP1_XENNA|nr:hypothetical protein XNC1_2418 [Xenorhabdus nematophila ATCC 19061]CEK23319.1 hypothetical protein XNC2_2325 [Xenorhabdus nematophila AN6/1]
MYLNRIETQYIYNNGLIIITQPNYLLYKYIADVIVVICL